MRVRTIAPLLLLLLLVGCTRTLLTDELRGTSEPQIRSLLLTSGAVVQFDENFGWYDVKARTVEGVTTDGRVVVVKQNEITHAVIVRGYSLYIAAVTLVGLVGVGLYAGFLLLHLFKIL